MATAVRKARERDAAATARGHGVSVDFDGDVIRLSKNQRTIRLAAHHLVYVPTVAEQFESFWGAVIPTDVATATVDYSVPRLQKYADSGLEFWISSFPEEPDAIASYRHRHAPREGGVVFDLGAYCGVSTYYFSRWVGESGRVVAVEPDPLNFGLLERNVAMHGLANVTTVNAAVAGRTGERSFNIDGTLGAALSDVIPRGILQRTATVEALTLENVAARSGTTPDFIKMDVEGAEVEVLRAAGDFLYTARCPVVIDSSHTLDGKLTRQAVERALSDAGYAFESSTAFGLMTTWGWPADASA